MKRNESNVNTYISCTWQNTTVWRHRNTLVWVRWWWGWRWRWRIDHVKQQSEEKQSEFIGCKSHTEREGGCGEVMGIFVGDSDYDKSVVCIYVCLLLTIRQRHSPKWKYMTDRRELFTSIVCLYMCLYVCTLAIWWSHFDNNVNIY